MKKRVCFLFLLLLISCSLLSVTALADPGCLHENVSTVPGTPASCTEDGYQDCYCCDDCGLFFKDQAAAELIGDDAALDAWKLGEGAIPAGHAMGDWETDAAGKHVKKCRNCDYSETHDPDWDDGSVTTAPTCTEKGVKTFTCQSCTLTYTEDVKELGHEFGDWVKKDDDSHQRVCKKDPSHTEEKAHTWDEGVVNTPASCDTDGEMLYTCSVCAGTKTEVIPMGHDWGEWEKSDTEHRRVCKSDPTHEEKGGHDWDDGVITKPADCGVEGVKTYTCKVCSMTRTEPIPALVHQYGDWKKYDDNVHQRVCANNPAHVESDKHNWDSGIVTKEPTIASKGLKVYHCDVCAGTKEEELDRLPLDTKTEASALTEVPDGLKANAELDSVDKITAAMKTALKKKNSSEKMAFYDVKLMYSTDHGKTWQVGGKEFFPAGGKLLVTIPYPAGTNSVGYNFVAVHMFGSSDFGKTAGEIEYPTVKKLKNGIQLELTGLSPVGLSWYSAGVSTGDDNNAPLWVMLLALSTAAFSAAVICEKKRKAEADNN